MKVLPFFLVTVSFPFWTISFSFGLMRLMFSPCSFACLNMCPYASLRRRRSVNFPAGIFLASTARMPSSFTTVYSGIFRAVFAGMAAFSSSESSLN